MSEIIELKKTSKEFKRGFMAAMRCLAKIGESECYKTKEQFLHQITAIVELQKFGIIFNEDDE